MVTVQGSNMDYHRETLKWMLSCCVDSGIRSFKGIAVESFFGLIRTHLNQPKFSKVNVLERELVKPTSQHCAKASPFGKCARNLL